MLAIILGSGLGSFVGRLANPSVVSFREAGLPESKVAGHEGRFVFGQLGGGKIICAQGRVHLYEGWSPVEVTAGIRWLARQGVNRCLLTNAAGSLNPDFQPGHWMMLSDHINLTGASPITGAPNFVDLSEVYSSKLRDEFRQCAKKSAIPLHEGVYAGVPGPQYETPAEVRMLRALGADAVGMSTVLEAIQARALEIDLAAFSCLTNWGAGMTPQGPSHTEVLAAGRNASARLADLLAEWIEMKNQES